MLITANNWFYKGLIVFREFLREVRRLEEKELTQVFGTIVKSTHGFDPAIGPLIYTCAIPDLYVFAPKHSPRITGFRDALGLAKIWQAAALQGEGMSRDESIADLYEKITEHGEQQNLYILQKDITGQSPKITPGNSYGVVDEDDKDHSHADPRIANFVSVAYHPTKGFIKGSMDGAHAHLKLGKP